MNMIRKEGKQTWKTHGHSHTSVLCYHMFWHAPCNQIAQHTLCYICHKPTACDCCASSWSVSWFQQGHQGHGKGHGANNLAQGTQTPFSSALVWFLFSGVSMAPCAFSCAFADSGPSESLGCRSHTHTCLILVRSWVRGTPPQHLDLKFRDTKVTIFVWDQIFTVHRVADNNN